MKIRRKAFILILALFIVTFISVLALAFLGAGPMNYRTAMSVTLEQQVHWLAQSGIEDARIKLQRDPDFPPSMGDEGLYFSYSEQISDLGGTSPIGSFEVTVDKSHAKDPYYLVILNSTGRLSRQGQEMKSSIRAEVDISPSDRRSGHEDEDNPNFYKIVNWSEEAL